MKRKVERSKPGPDSYKAKAKRQRGAGLVSRREARYAENLTEATLKAYRGGFNIAWRDAGEYMARKGIPRAGQFRKDNIHGGKLFASRKECKITDKMAGQIIERVYLAKRVGVSQLKQVRHMLSYAHYLTTGVAADNYPEVKAQWKSFKLSTLPGVKRPLKPTRIPTPKNLKAAWTKQWTPNCGMSLTNFTVAGLASYDTHIFGLRPNVDMKKVKDSRLHEINLEERYGYTEMVDGRSKLHGNKRGTRPWVVNRVCFCGGQHIPVPEDLLLSKAGNPQGQPAWNTVCPLAIMEFLKIIQGKETWKPYTKWFPKQLAYGQNHGDVATLANKWLEVQEVPGGPFSRNCGRKSLSRWCDHLKVGYEQSVHIHGDLECCWRSSYQRKLTKSGYRNREQSEDPEEVTKALRRFARWLHAAVDRPPKVPLTRTEKMLARVLQNQNDADELQRIIDED